MYSASEKYPILCKEMEFECLFTPATIYIIASAQHFAVLVSLRDHPEVSLIPSPHNPHACISEIIAEKFYDLTEEYLFLAEENDFSLPLPRHDADGKEPLAQFIHIEAILPIFKEDNSAIENIHVNEKFFILTEDDATIEEFFGDGSKNAFGNTLS